MGSYKPHVIMVLCNLISAFYLSLLHTAVGTAGVSSTVLVIYQHVLSTVFLFVLAFFFERENRLPITCFVVCWTFFLGFLHAMLTQMMGTWTLHFVTASFQSVSINTAPMVVFVLAVMFRREQLQFFSLHGQAKIWGTICAFCATLMVLSSEEDSSETVGGRRIDVFGCFLVAIPVLATAAGHIFVEYVSKKFPAHITLSALMNFYGTLQVIIYGAITEKDLSSWEIKWDLELLVIIYGGLFMTGLVFYAKNWCINKRGPVFTTSFSPLLVVFSFILEIINTKKITDPWRLVGAVLVIGGLYLLLWGKAKEYDGGNVVEDNFDSSQSSLKKPMLAYAENDQMNRDDDYCSSEGSLKKPMLADNV